MRVVANIHANLEQAQEVKDILVGLIEPTRREAGCILYELLQDLEDPAEFCFVEEWESGPHLEAHLKTAHFLSAAAALEGKVSRPTDIKSYDLIA